MSIPKKSVALIFAANVLIGSFIFGYSLTFNEWGAIIVSGAIIGISAMGLFLLLSESDER